MEAHTKKITEVFNKNRFLEIPYYQRSYVWREHEWNRFLEDMEDLSSRNKPYFIGSMILKQKLTPTGSVVGDIRLVIDGQQRLTTIVVFFKVLSLLKQSPKIFDTFLLTMNKEQTKLDEDGPINVIALKHNHIDAPSFEKITSLSEPIDFWKKDNGEKYSWYDENDSPVKNPNQIIKLYQHFKNYISNNLDKFSSTDIKGQLEFVVIDLGVEEDEQQIFDTINSLGVVLTTSELLKNYFFDANNLSDYETYWKSVFEIDKETKDYWDQEIISGTQRPHLIDIFFNAFLMIKIHDERYDVSTEDKKEFMRVDKLFNSYKTFIKQYLNGDKDLIIQEVHECAKIFKKFL